jgi:hypothetical protein
MEKRYYTAESLAAELRAYEATYGVSTSDFYADYCAHRAPRVDPFDAVVWADGWRELQRLGADTQADLIPSAS